MNITQPHPGTHDDAGTTDRLSLHAVLALIVGLLVASPALTDSARDSSLVLTLIAAGVVGYLLQRQAPARPRISGGARLAAQAGGFVAVMALLSISFGIVAADAAVWVAAPAAIAAGLTFLVSRLLDS